MEGQKQEIQIDTLFAKIGFLTWANDSLVAQIDGLKQMCSALEAENKELKAKPEKEKKK